MENMQKICPKFSCEKCHYNTSKKSCYNQHLMTAKHQKSIIINENQSKICSKHKCDYCNKSYKEPSGLWRHNKVCSMKNNDKSCDLIICDETSNKYEELMINLITQNIELQKQVIELCKEKTITVNNTTNNTTNHNNQSFNMNVFLNEQCKDAINIGDFVNSLPLTLEDLENTGRVGYVKGLTDIVMRGLKEMDVHKRPIHCSDLKREVMYVKDNDVWQKDEDNVKVKKAIQNIGTRNYRQVKEWIEKYPEAKDNNTKKHEQYVQIRLKCTGGSDNAEDDKLQNKILSSIAKFVHIDKAL
jgi:hypothetical protein